MVFTVRCFKCSSNSVRLVLGGRKILHAKCESCGANLLEEIMELEANVALPQPKRERKPTLDIQARAPSLEEDTTTEGVKKQTQKA